jgi:hypothetical protein
MKTRVYVPVPFCCVLLAGVLGASLRPVRAQDGLIRTSGTPLVRLQGLDGRFYDVADLRVLRDPTQTTYLQFAKRTKLPMPAFFRKDGRLDGPTQVGMSSSEDNYKERVRARLDALLAESARATKDR